MLSTGLLEVNEIYRNMPYVHQHSSSPTTATGNGMIKNVIILPTENYLNIYIFSHSYYNRGEMLNYNH